MTTLDLILIAAAVVVLPFATKALFRALRKAEYESLAKFRNSAYAQFNYHRVGADEARFRFDGRTAIVVNETESYHKDDGGVVTYSLTRFARNSEGEYFMFVSNPSSKPFFKHVEHRLARIALKSLYVPPKTDG